MEHFLKGSVPFWILQFLQGMIPSGWISAIKEVNDWVPRNIKDIQAVCIIIKVIKLPNAVDFINIDNEGN